jgi:hypothetical protein
MSDEDFENTDAPDNDFAFERASHVPIIFRNPHAEDCPLSVKENWRLVRGVVVPKPGFTCACVKSVPVRDVPVWVEPKEVDEMPIYEDLPHPGISEEFWVKVPESDRDAFSKYLVKAAESDGEDERDVDEPDENEGLIGLPELTTKGGWCAPSELLGWPDITARRGGIAFTGMSEVDWNPYKGWSKKQYRDRMRELQTLLDKERKRTRKLRRKVTRLLAVVERLAGK